MTPTTCPQNFARGSVLFLESYTLGHDLGCATCCRIAEVLCARTTITQANIREIVARKRGNAAAPSSGANTSVASASGVNAAAPAASSSGANTSAAYSPAGVTAAAPAAYVKKSHT